MSSKPHVELAFGARRRPWCIRLPGHHDWRSWLRNKAGGVRFWTHRKNAQVVCDRLVFVDGAWEDRG